MTTVTENDLRRVEEKIDKLTQTIETRFNDLEKNQIRMEAQLQGIDKRLDNLEGINRAAVAGVLISLFGVIATATAKFLFFPDV